MRHARSLSLGDYLVLGIALFAVVLSVGRFFWHAAVFADSYAQNRSWPESREVLAEWWGARFFPSRDGGDYLAVLANHDHWRTPNFVIGAALEAEGQTSATQLLIIPTDLGLMRPGPRTSNYQRADGSVWSVESVIFTEDRIRWTTAMPIEQRVYDPALDDDTVTDLLSRARAYPHGTYYVPPPPGGSGTFVVHTDSARDRVLIVPLELSPEVP